MDIAAITKISLTSADRVGEVTINFNADGPPCSIPATRVTMGPAPLTDGCTVGSGTIDLSPARAG